MVDMSTSCGFLWLSGEALGFELRASHLLDRYLTLETHLQSLVLVIFQAASLRWPSSYLCLHIAGTRRACGLFVEMGESY
jgi:hypothetical protein